MTIIQDDDGKCFVCLNDTGAPRWISVDPVDATRWVSEGHRVVRADAADANLCFDHGVPLTEFAPIKPTKNPYARTFKGVTIDPYRIFHLYGVTDGAIQHAVKKLLRAGTGKKSLVQDVTEARDSLDRLLEMIAEDGESE